MTQISTSQHLPVRNCESGKIRLIKVVSDTCTFVCANISSTFLHNRPQENQIKYGMIIAPYSGNVSPMLCLGGSYSFGVINILAWPHSKCSRMVKVVIPRLYAQNSYSGTSE